MGKNKKIYLVPDGFVNGVNQYKVSRTENLLRPRFGEVLLEGDVLNWIRDPEITIIVSGSSRLYKEQKYRPLLAHGEE